MCGWLLEWLLDLKYFFAVSPFHYFRSDTSQLLNADFTSSTVDGVLGRDYAGSGEPSSKRPKVVAFDPTKVSVGVYFFNVQVISCQWFDLLV